jgi:hypothetical protein
LYGNEENTEEEDAEGSDKYQNGTGGRRLFRLARNQFQRDRTFVINAIVSEHAQRHRGKVPPPLRIIPM